MKKRVRRSVPAKGNKSVKSRKGSGKGHFEMEADFDCDDISKMSGKGCGAGGGCMYFLGVIGSAVYYVSTATSFWMGFLGILKSLVWPAFLIFELLQYLAA